MPKAFCWSTKPGSSQGHRREVLRGETPSQQIRLGVLHAAQCSVAHGWQIRGVQVCDDERKSIALHLSNSAAVSQTDGIVDQPGKLWVVPRCDGKPFSCVCPHPEYLAFSAVTEDSAAHMPFKKALRTFRVKPEGGPYRQGRVPYLTGDRLPQTWMTERLTGRLGPHGKPLTGGRSLREGPVLTAGSLTGMASWEVLERAGRYVEGHPTHFPIPCRLQRTSHAQVLLLGFRTELAYRSSGRRSAATACSCFL